MHVGAEAAAFAATVFYYIAYALWKRAAAGMEPLRGTRPIRTFVVVIGSGLWWAGLAVTLVGAALQGVALAALPIALAAPIFAASLGVLLLIAMAGFGERLTLREWGCLGMFAAAMVMVSLSVRDVPAATGTVPPLAVLAVCAASLPVPVVLFALGDRRPEGRHARPIAGVAYGIAIGLVCGTSEVMIKGMAALPGPDRTAAALAATPYPYALVVSAVLSWATTQIALQRSRLAVVMSVGTIVAQAHLLLTGTFLYGEAWPQDEAGTMLRLAALATAFAALLLFPRQEAVKVTHRASPMYAAPVIGAGSDTGTSGRSRANGVGR